MATSSSSSSRCQITALVDINSAFASMEETFDPSLKDVGLGVLSSNDGCLIARSSKLKALGVPMGEPAFRLRHLVESGQIILKSSNYELYSDLSMRFECALQSIVGFQNTYRYSIDEFFVDLTEFADCDLQELGFTIKERVRKWTGLPIGIGISNNKVLAKLAQAASKKFSATKGVVDLTSHERQQRLMKITPVSEVWGVGRKISARLKSAGIETAHDLASANRRWIRKNFSVVLERVVAELNGELALPLEEEYTGNKNQIMCSRSFGNLVTSKNELHAALASFISRAVEKLREQGKFASEGLVFIRTDPFKSDLPQYSRSFRIAVPSPTNDTRLWLAQLPSAIEAIFIEGYQFKKAGFCLVDISDGQHYQGDLLALQPSVPDEAPMMSVVDAINSRYGRNTLRSAATDLGVKWQMKQESVSPRYTTRWNEIMTVQCK